MSVKKKSNDLRQHTLKHADKQNKTKNIFKRRTEGYYYDKLVLLLQFWPNFNQNFLTFKNILKFFCKVAIFRRSNQIDSLSYVLILTCQADNVLNKY